MGRLRGFSLVDQAQEALTRRIDQGELKEGDRLIIDRLAREFGTSLVPVREALARMHMQRILLFEPNKGYSVAPVPGEAELGALFDARLAFEIGALELSAARVDQRTIERMLRLNEEMRSRHYEASFSDYHQFARLNAEFHRAIVAVADNALVAEAYENLGYHQRIARTLSGRGVHDIPLIVMEHQAIVDALKARDLDACRTALRSHILDSKLRYVEHERQSGLTETPDGQKPLLRPLP